MAEENQERTEEATPKRRSESKEKGQVAKSRDLSSVAILSAALIYFYFNASDMLKKIMTMLSKNLHRASSTSLSPNDITMLGAELTLQFFFILYPLMLTVVIAALLSNILQSGFIFSPEAIAPKLSKLDPIKGMKNLLGTRSLVELVKNILKVTIVALVAYLSVKSSLHQVIPLMNQDLWQIFSFIGRNSYLIIANVCLLLVIVAVLDFAYQKWEFEKSIKMSKQEVKEENKQSEGDPLIKGRIRRLQRDAARKRMMASVPKADVVITNPTHIAIAIRYDSDKMAAPVVLAKGTGFIAERIKEVAKASGVPVVENKLVAQLLYKLVDIDEAIPENLYRAVAEILAYVYGMKKKQVWEGTEWPNHTQ
jgi:flagellar biosynthetic protein FlhB